MKPTVINHLVPGFFYGNDEVRRGSIVVRSMEEDVFHLFGHGQSSEPAQGPTNIDFLNAGSRPYESRLTDGGRGYVFSADEIEALEAKIQSYLERIVGENEADAVKAEDELLEMLANLDEHEYSLADYKAGLTPSAEVEATPVMGVR
jgi:hypothetical protein